MLRNFVGFYKFCISKSMQAPKHNMEYRSLGPSGIKVSIISFGNWLNSNSQEASQLTTNCVKTAFQHGVNFFDTAQVYGAGEAEIQMGKALKALNVPRHHYVLSTKLYWGNKDNIPNTRGLSRKHIIQGMKNSLKRLEHDYADIVFCHRPDYQTPMEQTCRAFDWLIRKGYTFYWGTSQWAADDIAEAHMICERYNLRKPIAEQPQYNLFVRDKIQSDYKRFFQLNRLGTTVWSPLLGGVLSGKYNEGIPQGSRVDKTDFKYDLFLNKKKDTTIASLKGLKQLADEFGCSMAQLAMAWVINNPDVSTAITGATKVQQLVDTFKALQIRKKLTKQIEQRIEKLFNTRPQPGFDMKTYQPQIPRRVAALGYK